MKRRRLTRVLCLALLVSFSSPHLAVAQPVTNTSGPVEPAVPDALLPPLPGGAPPLLSLEDALTRAARHNEDVAIALERVAQAGARRDRAWAAFKPSLRATGTFTHRDKGTEFGGRTITLQDELAGSVTANLQLLDVRAIKGIEASYELLEAARADAESTRRSVLFEVARTYYSAAAAQTMVGVARRNIEKADATLRTARDRLEGGIAIPIDVSRARLSRLQAEKELIAAENTVQSLEEVLRFLTGLEGTFRVDPPSAPVSVPPAATIEEAEKAAPSLDAALLRVEANDDLAEGAWYQLLPKLNVLFTYQATQNTGFSGEHDQWNVQLVLDWILYDGGARYADMAETAAERNASQLTANKVRRSITRQIRQLALELRAATATSATATEQRDVAQEQYDLVHARFESGLADSLEVSDADAALFASEGELVRTRLQRDLASINLLEALSVDPSGIGGN